MYAEEHAIKAVLDVGHAAIHRKFSPTESDLNTALDIAEGIVAAIFVHIPSAYDLSNRVPRRTPSGKIIPWKRASDIPNEQRTKNEETLTGKKKKEATNSRGGINNFD